MELQIVKYLKEHGLDKTVSDFKLKCREYPHKVILKYDQLNSSYENPEVCEARGLVLEKGTWRVLSLAYEKFFNVEEGYAAKIDWESAIVMEKCDGSLITLYYDDVINEWCTATTGTANGEGDVNSQLGFNFSDLFWQTAKKYNINKENCELNKNYCYMFELQTPYNIVVVPHTESKITWLGMRNRITLKEVSYNEMLRLSHQFAIIEGVRLDVVQSFPIEQPDFGWLKRKFKDMSMFDEGFVVVDKYFNRVKVKNPSYIELHHTKTSTGLGITVKIIQTNEIDEWLIACPERRDEIMDLKRRYDSFANDLESIWFELQYFLPRDITPEEKKKFASKVFELCGQRDLKQYSGLYFGLQNGKIPSVKDYLFDYDSKDLFYILEKR